MDRRTSFCVLVLPLYLFPHINPSSPLDIILILATQGIRGIAACMVVVSHVIMSLHDHIVYPSSEEVMRHNPSHWPFIHAPAEGFPWLATFFVLSGWVNALKPLALVDSEQSDRALTSLSSGCLRRSARLMLPPAIATGISWVLAQVGAYKIANAQGNSWMKNTSPEGSSTLGIAISDFVKAIYTTWTEGTNYYDGNQWCMLSFLKGSMTLYLVLMATVKATPRMRRIILGIMFVWSWRAHDGTFPKHRLLCICC
jgi:peptidoglycan/LPS O-acetylase OafA/YrhL